MLGRWAWLGLLPSQRLLATTMITLKLLSGTKEHLWVCGRWSSLLAGWGSDRLPLLACQPLQLHLAEVLV